MVTVIPEAVNNKTVFQSYLISWYKIHAKSSLFTKIFKYSLVSHSMKIQGYLLLQLLSQETFARKCDLVNRKRLHKSCMICNRLVQNNFPAGFGVRINAACITLSRNQCCMPHHRNHKHEPESHKLNGFDFLQTALV